MKAYTLVILAGVALATPVMAQDDTFMQSMARQFQAERMQNEIDSKLRAMQSHIDTETYLRNYENSKETDRMNRELQYKLDSLATQQEYARRDMQRLQDCINRNTTC